MAADSNHSGPQSFHTLWLPLSDSFGVLGPKGPGDPVPGKGFATFEECCRCALQDVLSARKRLQMKIWGFGPVPGKGFATFEECCRCALQDVPSARKRLQMKMCVCVFFFFSRVRCCNLKASKFPRFQGRANHEVHIVN